MSNCLDRRESHPDKAEHRCCADNHDRGICAVHLSNHSRGRHDQGVQHPSQPDDTDARAQSECQEHVRNEDGVAPVARGTWHAKGDGQAPQRIGPPCFQHLSNAPRLNGCSRPIPQTAALWAATSSGQIRQVILAVWATERHSVSQYAPVPLARPVPDPLSLMPTIGLCQAGYPPLSRRN